MLQQLFSVLRNNHKMDQSTKPKARLEDDPGLSNV